MNPWSAAETSATAPETSTSEGSPTPARVAESPGISGESLIVEIAADVAMGEGVVGVFPTGVVVLLPSALGGAPVGVAIASCKDIVLTEVRGVMGEGIPGEVTVF